MKLNLIQVINTWKEDARIGDWLHPEYGPFPNFAALYEDEIGKYLVAVWCCNMGWVSMVEGEAVNKYDNIFEIAHTYYWKRISDTLPVIINCFINDNNIINYIIKENPLKAIAKLSIVILREENG
ncbi:MAG: hypothetical protein ACFFFC_00420 [Candidatus Thorarchaeota archaeon]